MSFTHLIKYPYTYICILLITKYSYILIISEEQQSEFDDLPKIEYRAPPQIPKEEAGIGCNSKVYFVCNERKYGCFLKHMTTAAFMAKNL